MVNTLKYHYYCIIVICIVKNDVVESWDEIETLVHEMIDICNRGILVQSPPVILGHTQWLTRLSTCGFVLNYLFL